MEGPPLGPGGEDITWPDQVAPRGRKASSTRKIKPQNSNLHTTSTVPLKRISHMGGVGLLVGHCLWQQYFEKKIRHTKRSRKLKAAGRIMVTSDTTAQDRGTM